MEIPLVQPRTSIEREVAAIWAEILEVEQVGIDDNFFLLGGDSLLASRVISRVIHTFRIDVPLRMLFDAPTVAAMASVITQNTSNQATWEDVERMLAEVERLSEQQAHSQLSKQEK